VVWEACETIDDHKLDMTSARVMQEEKSSPKVAYMAAAEGSPATGFG
jgi:hypothetical protein